MIHYLLTLQSVSLKLPVAIALSGNGTIEFEEFVAMMSKKMTEKDTEDEIKSAFKAFDTNNSGAITGTILLIFYTHIILTDLLVRACVID